jgi:hypothetical protein
MKILGSSTIVRSTDRGAAVSRFSAIFGVAPLHQFPIEGRDLTVDVFPGLSILSGPAPALDELADLRATVFVVSLAEAQTELTDEGWTTVGSLGSGASLLVRDPDGNTLEFVENPDGTK